MATSTVLLFSYGTLQDKDVQIATFGRELTGRHDALPRYRRVMVSIGGSTYANVEPSSQLDDAVSGTVFEVMERELEAVDQYEEDAGFRRILVTLRSGVQAWVYARE